DESPNRSWRTAGDGGVVPAQQRSRLLRKRAASLSHGEAARGSLHEPRADALLQSGERPSDGRWRPAQATRRSDQAPLIEHGEEHRQLIETVHGLFLIMELSLARMPHLLPAPQE